MCPKSFLLQEIRLPVHDIDLKRWGLQKAKQINFNQFKASNTWLLNFKKKFSICSRKITKFVTSSHRQDDANIKQNAENFVENSKLKLQNYLPNQVLNSDQSGFKYDITGNRTLSVSGERTTEAVTQ